MEQEVVLVEVMVDSTVIRAPIGIWLTCLPHTSGSCSSIVEVQGFFYLHYDCLVLIGPAQITGPGSIQGVTKSAVRHNVGSYGGKGRNVHVQHWMTFIVFVLV